ncbi:MAG: efflux RND transporter periplasmic adaptor subunit [Gemmatimonadota bacterium]
MSDERPIRTPLLLVALAVVATAAACGRDEPGEVAPPDEAPEVRLVRPTATGGTVSYPATLQTVDRAELATRTSGTVIRAPVDVGSVVTRGDVVLEMDGRDVTARIQQTEAQLERARRSLERIESLHADGAATDQELDDVRAGFRTAEAALAEARAQRAYTALRAPFSGVVTRRSIDPGDLAVPGHPVITLAGGDALEAVADLPASREGQVAESDTLMLVHPDTGERFRGNVIRVSPAVESATRRFRVEVALPPDAVERGLRAGTYLRLEVTDPDPDRESLWVPATAVVRRGQLTGAFTVTEDTALLRWIRVGVERDGMVEVLGGLTADEAVILEPPAGLRDGGPVRISRSATGRAS